MPPKTLAPLAYNVTSLVIGQWAMWVASFIAGFWFSGPCVYGFLMLVGLQFQW